MSLSRPVLAWSAQGDAREWALFRERFITREGRVVDDGNGGVSHTEGQGWAMLMAESFNDRDTFERVWSFTRQAMKRPTDNLHAWRYRPQQPMPVDDLNNATDGDTFIAWSLLRGGQRWENPAYRTAGTAVARDMARLLIKPLGDRTVLLPGAFGFEFPDYVVVNPSYHMPLAIRDLARAAPDARWGAVQTDGLNLQRVARFGRWGLPADWVKVPRAVGRVSPAPGRPQRFSYDAIRVPLYMVWSGLVTEPMVSSPIAFWNDPSLRAMPAWTEFVGDSVSPYAATSGIRAVASLAMAGGDLSRADVGSVSGAHDYYAASLMMLARLAARDLSRPALS
ncbi:glycosyl hydrolase family 5 [Acetobacteraceae bacterium H6797]|nr:glycosyl hydrolase family 5 [Acetobacteraceae bacterium H6797]